MLFSSCHKFSYDNDVLTGPWVGLNNFRAYSSNSQSRRRNWSRVQFFLRVSVGSYKHNKNIIVAVGLYRQKTA